VQQHQKEQRNNSSNNNKITSGATTHLSKLINACPNKRFNIFMEFLKREQQQQ
jgi:hypothetical protein